MNQTFSSPQRQSMAGILIFFGYNLQKMVRNFWFFIIYIFYQQHEHLVKIIIGSLVLLLLILIFSCLNYWFFTFWIDSETKEFILKKGIINKTTIVLPIEKIQNVNLTQNVLHKMAKVYKIAIESAGSSAQEVSINALSSDLAFLLKRSLNEAKLANQEVAIDEIQIKKFKISTATLIKIGLTSRYRESIALFIAFVLYLGQYAEKFIENKWINENYFDNVQTLTNDYMFLFLAIPLIIFILLLVNLIRTIFKFYNYTFSAENDVLVFKYGLLKTREIILKPYKIQKITIAQNWLQRKLGLHDVAIQQLQDQGDVNKMLNMLQIPGLNTSELTDFLKLTKYTNIEVKQMLLPNIRRLILNVFFFVGLPAVVFLILKHFQIITYSYIFLYGYVILVLILSIIDYRNYKFYFNQELIKKQSGIWDVESEIVEVHKIQGIALQQYFWQKKTNIGSITFFTAGSNVSFKTTTFNVLVQNTNVWLYKIEKSVKKWI
jgi:putative membrane protein